MLLLIKHMNQYVLYQGIIYNQTYGVQCLDASCFFENMVYYYARISAQDFVLKLAIYLRRACVSIAVLPFTDRNLVGDL